MIEKTIRLLIENGIAVSSDFKGCSDEEVRRLESHVGLKLPSSYREFLSAMGHRAGSFLRGTDCFYKRLWKLREWAEEILTENGVDFRWPDDAFVFYMHQGYIFHFFKTSAGDDPLVFGFKETNEQHKQVRQSHETFSSFLHREALEAIRIRNRCQSFQKPGNN
jgi:hypothetical protein